MTELYYYILIPASMVAVGNLALIPFIHLALVGEISYFGFLYFAILGTVLSDSIWYMVGFIIPKKKILAIKFFRKKIEKVERFLNFFDRISLEALFLSKFVWGTRIATRLLAGMEKINFFKYIFITLSSSLIWIFGASVIFLLARQGVNLIPNFVWGLDLALTAALILIVIMIYLFVRKIYQDRGLK